MDYVFANMADVIEKLSFTSDARWTLLNDMLAACVRSEMEDGTAEGNVDSVASLRFSELRRKAQEEGLNVDGSREMLIAALNKAVQELHPPT